MADTPISTTIHAQGDLLALRRFLWRSLERRGCPSGDIHAVVLAAHEAAKNGLRFSGERPVYVTVHFYPDQVAVCVADTGEGFEYEVWRRRDLPNVQETSGRGLHLMHGLMDRVDVSVQPLGCVVRMAKRLSLEPTTE